MSQINDENQPIFSWTARHSDVGSRPGASTSCDATLSTGTGEYPTTLLTMEAVRRLGDCACDALGGIGRPSSGSMIQQGSGFGEGIAVSRVTSFLDTHTRAAEVVTIPHPRLAELAPAIAELVLQDPQDDQLRDGAYRILAGEPVDTGNTAAVLPIPSAAESR